ANLITSEIAQRDLTQAQAAELMRLKQPDVSNLTRGRLKSFSQERLESCLNYLDFDIRIQVSPGPRWNERPGVSVEVVLGGGSAAGGVSRRPLLTTRRPTSRRRQPPGLTTKPRIAS